MARKLKAKNNDPSDLCNVCVKSSDSTNPTMAQSKAKTHKAIAQKHLHSRISFLYRAATYLAKVDGQSQARVPCIDDESKKSCHPGRKLQCAATTPQAVPANVLHVSAIEPHSMMPESGPHNGWASNDFALSRQLLANLRAVSLRSQIKLPPAVKHTMCKRCNVLLIPGSTFTSYIENKSSGGRKPWADVLVTTCTACGTSKRFPVGAKRQVRKESRIDKAQGMGQQGHRVA